MSIILVSFDLIALSLFYKLVSSKAISREKQEKPFDCVSFDAPPSESPQSLWLINNFKDRFPGQFPRAYLTLSPAPYSILTLSEPASRLLLLPLQDARLSRSAHRKILDELEMRAFYSWRDIHLAHELWSCNWNARPSVLNLAQKTPTPFYSMEIKFDACLVLNTSGNNCFFCPLDPLRVINILFLKNHKLVSSYASIKINAFRLTIADFLRERWIGS